MVGKEEGRKKKIERMPRGEVKTQSTLIRFTAMKQLGKRKPDERRPFLASHYRDLGGADRRRSETLREIKNMARREEMPELRELKRSIQAGCSNENYERRSEGTNPRGEVKAQSTLTRFTAMKQTEKCKRDERCPFFASHLHDLTGIDRRRSEILREISNMARREETPELCELNRSIQAGRSIEDYEKLDRIAEGSYGVVYRARDKKSGEVVAVKKLKMEREKGGGFPVISLREINILLSIRHPSIVDMKEVVMGSTMDSIFIVMEFMENDLKRAMETYKQPFSESETKQLMLQLLEGLMYLHKNWIIHRAPELLLGAKEYSSAIDMWSVGCIFAELLAKEPLFKERNETEQLNSIFETLGAPDENTWPGYENLPGAKLVFTKQKYNLLRDKFPPSVLSKSGYDLLSKLLDYDPQKRITAEDALRHPWFSDTSPAHNDMGLYFSCRNLRRRGFYLFY
ncbi:cyclin-dependent kinase G-2-like isoform X2 [Carex littledalei]|uniref:[RNA-polymerase]-subunit kinase n=1 Tax=Carex littledalei TaxID=544730 RepID=A0A833V4C4_9POAL|nr:cyclin-dependent kinase G-2-like isoform X2 [Carex littledalei]